MNFVGAFITDKNGFQTVAIQVKNTAKCLLTLDEIASTLSITPPADGDVVDNVRTCKELKQTEDKEMSRNIE